MNQSQKNEFIAFTLGTLRGQLIAIRTESYCDSTKKKMGNLLELIEDAVQRVYLTAPEQSMGIMFQTEEN